MLVSMLQVNQDFTFEENQLQVAFVASGIWALRFPSKPAYQQFCREYEAKLFENMTGLAYNETNQAKVWLDQTLTWSTWCMCKILISLPSQPLAALASGRSFSGYLNFGRSAVEGSRSFKRGLSETAHVWLMLHGTARSSFFPGVEHRPAFDCRQASWKYIIRTDSAKP